ncbi:MAG: MmcQ/YjbR family DNA-binding protein [Xanthobacteraceae bacterium]|jgi:predicted DNA-binding protein (MmcQ/YjbR family)
MAKASQRRAEAVLRAYALSFPEANEDFPWGERVIKVRGKIFVFFATGDGGLRVSVKLPTSFEMALTLPFTAPTRYGLGRAKWITARFAADETPPVDLLQGWIEQSYRAVAPNSLVRALDGEGVKGKRSRVRRPA